MAHPECFPPILLNSKFSDDQKLIDSVSEERKKEAFNLTSRYLDDLLNIDNPYFESMVNQIYPPELQLN